jgi:hypothetical protein
LSTSDAAFKLRFSRLLGQMGYFVRRNVPISTYTPGENFAKRVDITDIDVLGTYWDEELKPIRNVCECKSGTKAKPLDRCFWLSGVMRFGAQKGYLVVKEAGMIPSSVGQRMDVIVINQATLTDLERRYEIETDKWTGSCTPDLDSKTADYKRTLKESFRPQLNYLIYGYWKDPEYYQIKRLITIGKEVSSKLSASSDASKWFYLESVCLFTNSIVTFCQKVFLVEPLRIHDQVSTQLFGGLMSKIEREGIAYSAVKFLEAYVETQYNDKLPLKADQIDLDPDYMENLVELISRLINRPNQTRLLPYFMDIVCFEFLFKGRNVSNEELRSYAKQNDVFLMIKLTKNLVKFYIDCTKSKTDVFDPLVNL